MGLGPAVSADHEDTLEHAPRRLRLWSTLNLLAATVLFGGSALFLGLSLLIGTDHSESIVDEWAGAWLAGAAGGLVVWLLASVWDRRYRPWAAGLALAGALSSSLIGTWHPLLPVPPVVFPVLLGVSAVLRARAGHGRGVVPTPRRQWLTGIVVTAATIAVVGVVVTFTALLSRSTPLYDAMRTDPMAADDLPGLTVRYDYSKDETTPFGIPSEAQVSRLWTITDGSTPDAKVAELEAFAQEHGWLPGPDPTFCAWHTTVDGFALCLVIRPHVEGDQVWLTITEASAPARRE